MDQSTPNDLDVQVTALIRDGIANNTAYAQQRDKTYFERWAQLRLDTENPFPVSERGILQFIVDHTSSMPEPIESKLIKEGYRRKPGPLALSTLRRYISTLATIHNENGWPDPTKTGQVKLLLRRLARQPQSTRIRKQAITSEILNTLIQNCSENNLIDIRDKALLLVGFCSGGRRRSEIANMNIEDLTRIEDGYLLTLQRSKTDQVGNGKTVPILGDAAHALATWLLKSGIRQGRLFRAVNRWGHLSDRICDRSIHRIIVNRLVTAGFDSKNFCAHSLRYGFLSEAGKQGIALGDAMSLSGHSTISTALKYYRAGETHRNPAAQIFQAMR